jgi:hypothetical protein
MIVWRMRIALWIPKATNTHSECAILIAFPLQVLHERSSMLRYTYIACTVMLCNSMSVRKKNKEMHARNRWQQGMYEITQI